MTEYNQTLHLTLVQDSVKLLRILPDESVDLIIADPPYNIDIEHWDKYDNYVEWAKEWIDEVYRVMKNDGNFVLFGGFQFQNKNGGDLLDLVYYIRKNTKFTISLTKLYVYNIINRLICTFHIES